jgi:hypothetical protein
MDLTEFVTAGMGVSKKYPPQTLSLATHPNAFASSKRDWAHAELLMPIKINVNQKCFFMDPLEYDFKKRLKSHTIGFDSISDDTKNAITTRMASHTTPTRGVCTSSAER